MDLPVSLLLARNSALLALGVCAISLPLGSLLGVLLARTDLPLRRLLAASLGAFLFVPLYLHAAGWQAAFGVQGWYTADRPEWAWLQGWRGAIWVHAMAAVPWVAMIVATGLRLVEPELEEEALLDASPARVWARVTLRRALAAVGVAALWIAVWTGSEMTVTDFFQVRTYAEEIYMEFTLGTAASSAALRALPGALAAGGLALLALRCCVGLVPANWSASVRPRVVFRLGAWRWPLAILSAALVLVVVGVPVANLAFKAGEVSHMTDAGLQRGWSPLKCLQFVAESPFRYRDEFFWSLLISGLAATAAVAVAIPLGWLACGRGRGQAVVLLTTAAALAVPGPIVGVAVIHLMNRPESSLLTTLYDRTIAAPWIAMTFRALPLATLVAWQTLRNVPSDLLDAAAAEGAGWWRQLWLVAVPQRRAGLGAAWLVALVVALGDLAASILVVPPGVMTLSIRVFEKLHFGQEDDVAGICLSLMLGFGLLTAALFGLLRRSLAKERQ